MKKDTILIGTEFKRLSLKSLLETTNNPQVMTKKELEGLARSMKDKGWILDAPVVWERPDGQYQIISGHHRVKAGIKAGILETGCKVVKGLTEDQVKILVIEANQRHGKFNDDLLNDFIDDIIESTQIDKDDLFDEIGFFKDEIDDENDPYLEWKDMPEYENEDKSSFKDVIIHFKNQDAIDKFMKLINQKITPATKYLWFPEEQKDIVKDLRYKSES